MVVAGRGWLRTGGIAWETWRQWQNCAWQCLAGRPAGWLAGWLAGWPVPPLAPPLTRTCPLTLPTRPTPPSFRPCSTNTIGAVARIRNALAYATHRFFQERGFLYVHTPIVTASDCEGAGEMFQVGGRGEWRGWASGWDFLWAAWQMHGCCWQQLRWLPSPLSPP